MAEWQTIGGIEVCEGTDGVVGVCVPSGDVLRFNSAGAFHQVNSKGMFEAKHCQPRHRLIECADGAVLVLSTDERDGKPRRGAMITQAVTRWFVCTIDVGAGFASKDQAIAAAVAYVTAR